MCRDSCVVLNPVATIQPKGKVQFSFDATRNSDGFALTDEDRVATAL